MLFFSASSGHLFVLLLGLGFGRCNRKVDVIKYVSRTSCSDLFQRFTVDLEQTLSLRQFGSLGSDAVTAVTGTRGSKRAETGRHDGHR